MSADLPPCELFVDSIPQSGQRNMDLDASMLRQAVEVGANSYVRIYQWDQPTVSLGYFQKLDEQVDARLKDCPRVRRITGGGAILHDDELTYSCAVPAIHPVRSRPVDLYVDVHTAIIKLLKTCGVDSAMRKDTAAPAYLAGSDEPFLCFLRADPRDVVYRGHKIVGSAQRRRKGAILQHGSILLRHSKLTPEVRGICDLVEDFDLPRFTEQLPRAVALALSASFRLGRISGFV